MTQVNIQLRPAADTDLEAINRVIEAAIMTWDLPDRVKRLSLQSYHYKAIDLQHYVIRVALLEARVVGVVAWDRQAQSMTPRQQGLFLHGLYIHPDYRRQGIGRRLFQCAEQAAREAQLDGMLVKAQKDAEAFYQACGMLSLPVLDEARDYAHRYWKPIRTPA